MRKPIIAGNWKMYKLLDDAVATAMQLKPLVVNANTIEVVIAPVFTALKTLADKLEGSNIELAAQDCATEIKHGAHTGEVAADMIKDAGATYVIIGHSERREFYGDTDESVNKKITAALNAKLRAIVCVGEKLDAREAGKAESIVKTQLDGALRGLTRDDLENIVIAYEPVWAIGTDVTATPEQAQEMHNFIRRQIADAFGDEAADKIRLLYGGSVKPDNAASLMKQKDIDGALVGGASLKAEDFAKIVRFNESN